MMKIALLTDGITPYVVGGMQKHSFNLAKYFTFHGVEVTLFHFVEKNTFLVSNKELNKILFGEKSNYTVKSYCYHFPNSLKFPGHYIYNSYRYSKLIFNSIKPIINEFDFIYTKGFCGWKLIQKKKRGIVSPNIGVNFHGFEMWQKPPTIKAYFQSLLLRPFVKWNIKNSDFVFSYGSKISELIKNRGINNNSIIESPSGIDVDFIRKLDIIKNSQKRKFLFIGRDERRKGIEELSEVIKNLNLEILNIEFHFVGQIKNENKLKSKNIYYYGLIKNTEKIVKIIDKMDVLICPSYSEGMPNVIIEAMARGLAIIATNVGAVSLLIDNKVGWLIDKDNLIFSLNKSINKACHLENDKLLLMKNSAIEKIIKLYRWDEVIKDLIKKLNNGIAR